MNGIMAVCSQINTFLRENKTQQIKLNASVFNHVNISVSSIKFQLDFKFAVKLLQFLWEALLKILKLPD